MTLHPAPVGTIVQNVQAYLAGDGMNSRYRLITSRDPVGKPPRNQWYLSVYAQDGAAFTQVFQSPGKTDGWQIVPRLELAAGTTQYFPVESVRIAGVGELMGEARDVAVISVRAASADCGMQTISLIQSDAGPGPIQLLAQASNPCGLRASIRRNMVLLEGPYYGKNAPLYKPTIAHARATLHFSNGVWIEKPNYFALKTFKRVSPQVTPLVSPSVLFTPIFKSILTTPAPTAHPHVAPQAQPRRRQLPTLRR